MRITEIKRDWKMNRQIFIYGHYGWKNTGDDAMIYVLLRELHILYPTATFAIISQTAMAVPQETKNLVKFVRPKPSTVIQEIKHSFIFVLGGGTHFHDYGIKIKPLKMLSKNFIVFMLSKLFCKRTYFLGIGLEPLSTIWGRFLTKQICRLADFISVRDESSYEILKGMRSKNKVILSFDLAALLQPLLTRDECLAKKTDMKILGISILPFFEIYHSDKEKDRLFVHEIAKGLNQWLKRDRKSLIYLFVFKGKSIADDVLITEMLEKQLHPVERVKLVPYNPDPVETMSKVAQCRAFVGMRYHSCLFAYLTNTPLLIVNYFQKCQALAEDVGLPKHVVISLEEILNGEFEKYLKNLQEHPDDFVATLPIDKAKQMAKKGLPMDGDLGASW
jgi:polysaccharide pyruvyl transferase WcaK-like protein